MRRTIDRFANRLRFNQKLFLSYLAVTIVPVFILGMYAYGQSKEMLDLQARQSIERDAATLAQSIGSSLEQYEHTIQSMAYNRTFQRIVSNDYLDLVNLSRDLNEYLAPYFTMMNMMDTNIRGIAFYTQGGVPEYGEYVLSHERVKNEPWYKEAVSKTGNVWVFDGDEIVLARQFPKFFSDTRTNVISIRIHNEGMFLTVSDLMRDYGVVIADDRHRPLYANRTAARNDSTEWTAVVGESGEAAAFGGETYFVVREPVAGTAWTLHCFIPASQVTPNAGTILNATMIVILSCIAILLAMISVFSRTMIRRIHQLNNLMKRVENGELQMDVKSDSKDEIGELFNRFGNMLLRLNELIRESYTSKIIQKEAELKALQSQIKPHFLYNTLSFIHWEAVKSGQPLISHVVTSMSKFYRTTLNKGDHLIPVKDELENIKSYLDILLVMNDYGFEVAYDIDEAVYGFTMPNLILQPVVENAVMHGIKKKEGGFGRLRIAATLRGQRIEFVVEDNGPGMNEAAVRKLLSEESGGYGIKNVSKRLQLYFGEDSALRVDSAAGRGTAVAVVIPARGRPELPA